MLRNASNGDLYRRQRILTARTLLRKPHGPRRWPLRGGRPADGAEKLPPSVIAARLQKNFRPLGEAPLNNVRRCQCRRFCHVRDRCRYPCRRVRCHLGRVGGDALCEVHAGDGPHVRRGGEPGRLQHHHPAQLGSGGQASEPRGAGRDQPSAAGAAGAGRRGGPAGPHGRDGRGHPGHLPDLLHPPQHPERRGRVGAGHHLQPLAGREVRAHQRAAAVGRGAAVAESGNGHRGAALGQGTRRLRHLQARLRHRPQGHRPAFLSGVRGGQPPGHAAVHPHRPSAARPASGTGASPS